MVVRGHQNDSLERDERIVECLDRFQIEVVRRRVQYQRVGLLDHHARDHAAHLLASGKHVHPLVDLVAAEKHLAQIAAQIEFARVVRELGYPVEDTELVVEKRRIVQRQIGGRDRDAPLHHARVGLVVPRDDFHERRDGPRLAGQESHLVAFLDGEGNIRTFESASFGGGRIVGTNNGANSEVHYFLTDHLGSTRVVAKVTPTGREDLDRKDYYPFGKEWTQSGMPTSDNRYTFSGKEQQHLRGQVVNYADFEARFYDSETGIFLQQDPLSEYSFQVSPYAYCGNNPINRIDLDGKRWDDPIQDAEIARQIKDAINAALNALISQEKRINNRINKINDNTKLSQEKKEERIAKEKQKLAEIDIQQDNLTYLSEGIDKMGSEDNPNIFTFETVEDEDGLTSTNTDGVTTMRNNGTFYNRVHEATHGAQIALGDLRVNQNGQALGGLSTPAREIQAYQNQAVLAGYETLPFSDHGGRPTKLKGITAPWIKGIKNSNGQYVY